MSRLKLFIDNFLIYGLGGIINKLIPLIMLPIITRLMPDTSYFGLSDLINTVVSFGSALAIMGMYDAMFRMFFEKEDFSYQQNICSSALGFTILTATVISLLLYIFRSFFSSVFFSDTQYKNLVFLSAISIWIGTTNTIVAAPTRIQNKRQIYLSINIFASLASYAVSCILLLRGDYLMALPLGTLISSLIIEIIYLILNHNWFHIKWVRLKSIKSMLVLGLPLLPNFLIYWIFNSCDRLMLAKFLGNDYVGIYAVGARLAHISQLIYTAFAGGWQYFAFTTMNDKDQVEMTSRIFEYLGIIAFAAGMLMAAVSHMIFIFLFDGDYVQGFIVAPWLFLAPLMQMLFQVIANQFLIIKKTWPSALILGSGAMINVIMNYVLIPQIGIEGAALATLAGYIVSVVVCVLILTKMNLVRISKKFLLASLLTLLYMEIWRLMLQQHFIISILISIIFIVMETCLYQKDIQGLFNKIKRKR